MKQNYIFATLAHGDYYNQEAFNLSLDLNYFKQKLLIVTDQKERYKSLDNVIIVDYPNKKFSYNDKIICFQEGFKYRDAVVFVDADSRVFYKNYESCYTNLIRVIEPGFHPSFSWGLMLRSSGGFFDCTGRNGRVTGYSQLALDISKKLLIPLENSHHYQEDMLILSKEDDKIDILLDTWRELSSVLDEYEIKNNSKKIGVGEGNLFGLSITKSGIKVNSNEVCYQIKEDVKYNFNLRLSDYTKNYPDRNLRKES